MKRTAAILFILATIAAQARPVWVYPPEERVRWYAPPDRAVDAYGQEWLDPSPAKLSECGWVGCEVGDAAPRDCVVDFSAEPPVRPMTDQELDAREAARAEAEAQAEAQASLPAVFPNGIAVLDEASHHIEFSPTGDGLPVLGWKVSDSPLEKAKRDAMKAERKAAHDALKAATKGAKNDKEKIALLMKAVFGVEE